MNGSIVLSHGISRSAINRPHLAFPGRSSCHFFNGGLYLFSAISHKSRQKVSPIHSSPLLHSSHGHSLPADLVGSRTLSNTFYNVKDEFYVDHRRESHYQFNQNFSNSKRSPIHQITPQSFCRLNLTVMRPLLRAIQAGYLYRL